MKKLFITINFFLSAALLFISCTRQKPYEYKLSYEDSIRIAKRSNEMVDSIINKAQNDNLDELKKESIKHSPVIVVKSKISKDEYGSKAITVTVKNTSKKTVDAVKIRWSLKDNFGDNVEEAYDVGQVQEKLAPGKIKTYNFEIYRTLATKVTAFVTDVHFVDGNSWRANR